jgi:hypothetical protein
MFCEDKKCPVYIECMERLDALPYCASKAVELVTTGKQQLKAKIAEIATEFDNLGPGSCGGEHLKSFYNLVIKLRQLSAV